MKLDQVKQLKSLQKENAQLKKLVPIHDVGRE
jgi:hypothetical protein